MTKNQIPIFDKLFGQIVRLDTDLAKLAGADAAASAGSFSIERINQLLESCENFLGSDYQPFGTPVRLTDVDGSVGNTALVVAQYVECFKAWRSANVTQRYDKWYWVIESPPQPVEYVLVKFPKKIDE